VVAVLDMGASAIRLVIAEIAADGSIHMMEEARRGILLGRDTFSSGVIPARTIDATLAALEGFHHLIESTVSSLNFASGSRRWMRVPVRSMILDVVRPRGRRVADACKRRVTI
jgi:hypothetical protein